MIEQNDHQSNHMSSKRRENEADDVDDNEYNTFFIFIFIFLICFETICSAQQYFQPQNYGI